MHSNLIILTLPEKALLKKLYYQNGESTTTALRSYRHSKVIRTGKSTAISSAVKRMISKFKTTGLLDNNNRIRSGLSSTRANTAQTVQDEMENVEGSSRMENLGLVKSYVLLTFHTLLIRYTTASPPILSVQNSASL